MFYSFLYTGSIFSDQNAVKLELNYRRNTVKNCNIWRLNNSWLNNQQITEEIKKEIKICIETNENENTTQNLWVTQLANGEAGFEPRQPGPRAQAPAAAAAWQGSGGRAQHLAALRMNSSTATLCGHLLQAQCSLLQRAKSAHLRGCMKMR